MEPTKVKTEQNRSTPELDRLLKKRDALPRQLFFVALENLAVFGVPAGIAVYVGIHTEHIVLSLAAAFLFSWTIFFVRFRILLGRLNTLEKDIDAERARAGIAKPSPVAYPEDRETHDDDDTLPSNH